MAIFFKKDFKDSSSFQHKLNQVERTFKFSNHEALKSNLRVKVEKKV